MYFLISNENTHGEESHWDVTITSQPELVQQSWRISPDLELEGFSHFIKTAKAAHIKSVSVGIELLDEMLEGLVTEEILAKYFEISDYFTEKELSS